MTYQLFVENICKQLNELLTDDIFAEIHTSIKNNNTTRLGITITNPDINISPTMYIEDFYEQYQNGCPIYDIALQILEVYDEIRFDHCLDLEDIVKFESISKKIAYKLIHFEKNLPLLQTVPYIRFHDLAIVFFLFIEIGASGAGFVLITNDMMNSWDVTVDTLYNLAGYNTEKLFPAELNPMCSVICELLQTPCTPEDILDNHMYVLTNSIQQFGSSTLLYPEYLEEIAYQLQDDYYILPCSIHELIIIPHRFSPPVSELNRMISEVNASDLNVDEFLSDHAYYYNRTYNALLFTS